MIWARRRIDFRSQSRRTNSRETNVQSEAVLGSILDKFWLQDGPTWGQDGPTLGQDGPTWSQDVPEWGQDVTKKGSIWPKWNQDGTKAQTAFGYPNYPGGCLEAVLRPRKKFYGHRAVVAIAVVGGKGGSTKLSKGNNLSICLNLRFPSGKP